MHGEMQVMSPPAVVMASLVRSAAASRSRLSEQGPPAPLTLEPASTPRANLETAFDATDSKGARFLPLLLIALGPYIRLVIAY